MYNIDKSKLKPDMIIHTPTFEQMKALLSCIAPVYNLTDSKYKANYSSETCINTSNLDECWSYSNKSYYESKKLKITPFEDILIESSVTTDWKTILLDHKCCVKVTTVEELETLSNFLGKTADNSWLDKYNPLMIYNEKRDLLFSSLNYAISYEYKIYEFSEIFPPQPTQEPSMAKYKAKYKVGDTFKNSKGNLCLITKVIAEDTYTYLAYVDNKEYNTTTYNIDKHWARLNPNSPTPDPVPLYLNRLPKAGDYVHRDKLYITDNSEKKGFLLNDGSLKTFKVTTVRDSDISLEDNGIWTTPRFNVINPAHPDHPDYVKSNSVLKYQFKIGDRVHIKPNLTINDRYVVPDMLDYAGKVFTIEDIKDSADEEDISVTLAEDTDSYSWHPSCLLPVHVISADTLLQSLTTTITTTGTVLSISTANTEPTIKDKPMAKSTLKDNISTQMTEVKGAAVNAAELKAGQLINKQAIKLLKPQLPMMVRGFADHPAASVVLANVIGLALKQYAPENPKLAKVSSLMLNAAAFDTIDSFNIDEMIDNLLSGIKLPADVSIDE